MAQYPGFFASVVYGTNTITAPVDTYDVSGATFALVYHEEQADWKDRWTTWSLDADSLLYYQPQAGNNKIIVGNDGHLYILDDEVFTDDGKAIPISMVSNPIPEVQDDTPASTWKRFQDIWWELNTPPPSSGYTITVSLTDVHNSTNKITRIVTQTSTHMQLRMALRCKQAILSISTTVGKDFDPISIGWSFMQESVRKQKRSTLLQ